MLPIVALVYDFDHTLSKGDMQDFAFIPSLGMTPEAFWQKTAHTALENGMDSILASMYQMLEETRKRGKAMTREYLMSLGQSVQYYPGVADWFEHVNSYALSLGLKAEHYIVSAGMAEIIEGTPIAGAFARIYACRYRYNEQGVADWPAQSVNYTGKTQFLSRISKGVTELTNEAAVNAAMPDHERRVPFTRMMFIGDGMTDVPAMRYTRINGGRAVAVYTKEDVAATLLRGGRVDYTAPADYRAGSLLDSYVRRWLMEVAEGIQ